KSRKLSFIAGLGDLAHPHAENPLPSNTNRRRNVEGSTCSGHAKCQPIILNYTECGVQLSGYVAGDGVVMVKLLRIRFIRWSVVLLVYLMGVVGISLGSLRWAEPHPACVLYGKADGGAGSLVQANARSGQRKPYRPEFSTDFEFALDTQNRPYGSYSPD